MKWRLPWVEGGGVVVNRQDAEDVMVVIGFITVLYLLVSGGVC